MHIRAYSKRSDSLEPNRFEATVSSIEFTVSSIESSIETRYLIVNTREYRVSSVTLHLGGTVRETMSHPWVTEM